MNRPGRPPKPPDKKDIACMRCRNARDRFGESCYCTLYGIIIGYSKESCRGFEDDAYKVWEQENGS